MADTKTTIDTALEKLKTNNMLTRSWGNSMTACDMVQNILLQAGLRTRAVETQLTVTKPTAQGKDDVIMLGYDNLKFNGQQDTHLVLVTETEDPYLIDASIGHLLAEQRVVVEPLQDNDLYLGNYDLAGVKLTYQLKKTLRLPQLEKKNLAATIADEEQAKNTLKWLRWMVVFSCSMSLINFGLNSFLIILKMMWP